MYRDPQRCVAMRRISAGAEEPERRVCSSAPVSAHLRGGGGTSMSVTTTDTAAGASPRGRRNRTPYPQGARACRRISAGAEEPVCGATRPRTSGAHLRGGGGTLTRARITSNRTGASPRGRRNLHTRYDEPDARRRISAGAEEPSSPPTSSPQRRAHLRGGGGTRAPDHRAGFRGGASPRGRRNRWYARSCASPDGRISAGAEEPCACASELARYEAHLRGGGGTRGWADRWRDAGGASPRGRRNRARVHTDQVRHRRISAGAEEPPWRPRIRPSGPAHLRGGGGTGLRFENGEPAGGASPRGRRNLLRSAEFHRQQGRISAGAEEPSAMRCR